jgi:hypothetical protein
MAKRFGAAVFTALVLHAALIGLSVLRRHPETPRVLDRSVVVRAAAVELFVLTEDDGASSARRDRTPSKDEPSDRTVSPRATVAPLRAPSQRSGSASDAEAALDHASAPDPNSALAELGPGAAPETSLDGASEAGSSVGPRVDLGLDGSVMRRAALEARERGPGPSRAPRRRPVFSLSHWSESAVRSLAQRSAPWEGRALLALEWDHKGRLLSVTSSAASSSRDEWQKLAEALSAQLAARPNVGAPGGGRRVVYLVKSDLVLPDSKRSVLPAAKYASAEQLRENNLPPATALNFGVKADGSPATTRVVSVELVRSDAL